MWDSLTGDTASLVTTLVSIVWILNLFLAIIIAVGCLVVVTATGDPVRVAVGVALIVAGTGSMLAAALVLVLSDRRKARAATIQGILPLITLVALAISAAG